MIGKIFVSLPVKDLDKSMAFFKAIKAGSKEPRQRQDYGFMFGRSFD